MDQVVAAGAGFLLAVLWMDLMFDVQVLRRGDEARVESIATYYRRVTTDAQPMGRLIALVMVALLGALAAQLALDQAPRWVSAVSLACAGAATGLAGARVVPDAVRLGARRDPPATRAALARRILRSHLACLAAIAALLAVQLAAA